MIKWKHIIVRLAILGLLLSAIHFGTAPLIGFVLRTTVQMVTGSKLEIENLHASPFQTQMTSGQVRLGHPEKELENLFHFEKAEIKFDQASLLRKKFIVTSGTIEGLEFGTGRLDSGKIEDSDPSAPTNNYLLEMGEQAASGLGSLLNQRFEENFESVRVARDLVERWPEEYEQLLTRGKKLEVKIREFRDLADEFKNNPLNTLRNLPRIEKTLQDATRIQQELNYLQNQLVFYRKQAVIDRDNLLAAKQRDLARIEEIKTDKRLNGRSLSQLLVGDAQGRRVDQAISWVKWMRKTFPHPKKSLAASRGGGQTIRFAGQVDQPDLLFRSLKLNGHGTMDRKPYTFTGTLAGLTTQPEVYGKPAYLQLEADGDVRFTLKGMIDRSQKVDHDRVIVVVPDLKIASQDLKIDDKVKLQLQRSSLQITARIDLIGDEVSGQIKATQNNFDIQLASDMKNEFANEIKTMLNQDLKSVRQFEVVAKLSGSIDDPHWQLHSDLGPQISQAVNQTLVRGYEKKKAELIAKLNLKTDQYLQEFTAIVQKQEAKSWHFWARSQIFWPNCRRECLPCSARVDFQFVDWFLDYCQTELNKRTRSTDSS